MAEADFFIGQGDTSSDVLDTLLDADGVTVDIQGATVTFTVVPVATGTAIVNAAAASNDQVGDGSDGSRGKVSYSWAAGETNTAGFYLGSWTVTFAGGDIQTFPNSGFILIQISPDAPVTLGTNYLSVEEFKATGGLRNESFADSDVQAAVTAASRGIDEALGRRFWADANANQIRYYTPRRAERVYIDDLVTLTTLKTDADGDGTFENTWTANTDFVLGPLNAAADGKPYTWIDVHPRRTGNLWLPTAYPRSVQVTGKFGWATVPPQVKTLTSLIASRLIKRTREAPMGIVALGLDGATMRASQLVFDPEYLYLTDGLSRKVGFA